MLQILFVSTCKICLILIFGQINCSQRVYFSILILLFYNFLMEYQIKKEQILSSVQYTNLLSFSLVQNKLERNFKSIVQALLLNQTKTDDIASKADQIEDKLNVSTIKNAQDLDAIKQTLKLFNDRICKLEASEARAPKASIHSQAKSSSSKFIKDEKKEQPKNNLGFIQPNVFTDRSGLYDKKFDDVQHQIALLKQKMPTLQLMESDIENMKRDLTGLKGQIITYSNKSNKNLKRQSINVPVKRDSTPKKGKASFLVHSNSSVTLQNKENKPVFQAKDQNAKNQLSNDKIETDYDKQIEGLHLQVNTLNLCFEQLKVLVQDLRKKDFKAHSLLSQIEDKQKKLQDQVRKDSENFEKQLKSVQLNLLNMPSQDTSSEHEQRSPSSGNNKAAGSGHHLDQNSINFKNQLNDRLSKLQNSLQEFITQTQFSRFKTQSRDKMQEIQKKHEKLVNQYEQEIKKIYDMFINKDLDINRLGDLINSTSEVIKENNAQADRKHNIAMARIEQIKKGLQNLREDVEFYQSMNNQKEKKTNETEKTEGKEAQPPHKQKAIDNKAVQDLKRYFNNKLHDQRAYLVGLVRDLQKKQNAANGVNQQIANIWQKINEFNVFLGKKADAEDIKKNLVYLQKKINRLGAHLVKAQDNTEDARIAKTNWFCLSCDKNLMGYQGKIGRHVVWDQMPLKGVTKTTIQKKGLPSLKNK